MVENFAPALTVTVSEEVTEDIAALDTVKVYVVVTVGETVTGRPEVTPPTPLSISPVPFSNSAVRSILSPSRIVDWLAEKLEIDGGGGSTVIVTVAATDVPAELVTLSSKVVVAVGDTVTGMPDDTSPMPLLIVAVPLLNSAVKSTLSPSTIVVFVAVKLLIAGGDTTVMVTEAVTVTIAAFVTVNV